MPAAARRPQESLTGPQKCAVLCMALGEAEAVKILQQLGAEEVEQVCREIATMPPVGSEVVQAVLRELQENALSAGAVTRGGMRYTQQVLEQAVGAPRARQVLDRIQDQIVDTGLKRLKKAAPEVLAGILRGEHPQTIALILAHLDMRQTAAVVGVMDRELASDVLYRVARMEKTSPEMLAVVEAGLSSKTDVSLSHEMTHSGGPAAVARVLNLTGGALEKELIQGLGSRNADIASQVKALMFTFEDLLLLDGKSMQRLLREIDGKELALALKAVSDELKKHITSNMSERAAGALEEEVEMLGAVRVKDVEAAHARIIETVRSLEEAGEIMIKSRDGNDDIIS